MIIIPAILTSVRRSKDKGLRLSFATSEATTDQLVICDRMLDQYGIMFFKVGETAPEVDELKDMNVDVYDKKKTQSQRLRGVLFKVWKEEESTDSFEEFYRMELEKIIDKYKRRLP